MTDEDAMVDALKRFNRKERYWLIQNVLGEKAQTLGPDFREKLGKLIGKNIPEDAWWGTDYHLDWLVGALHLFYVGSKDTGVQVNEPKIIKGTQEDIDLIIAYETTLILVEAKAATGWKRDQLESKIARLDAILKCYEKHSDKLSVFFVMISPNCPSKNIKKQNWPEWMSITVSEDEKKPYWIPLEMKSFTDDGFSVVTRCEKEDGTIGKAGTHWKITKQNIPKNKARCN